MKTRNDRGPQNLSILLTQNIHLVYQSSKFRASPGTSITNMSLTADDLLQYQLSVLHYLDQTGTLEDIKTTCKKYTDSCSTQPAVYRFIIPVEVPDILDLTVGLGNLILKKPGMATKIFQVVVHMTIKELDLLPRYPEASQILVVLRIKSIPDLPLYKIATCKDLITCDHLGIYRYDGIVTGMTTVTKYTQSARFYCSVSSCCGAEGNKFIRLHVPGAREIQTIRHDFTCTYCGATLIEDVSARVIADKVIAEMVDEEAFHTCVNIGFMKRTRFQTMAVYLRDELSKDIVIGTNYSVIGKPVHQLQDGKIVNVGIEFEIDFPLRGSNGFYDHLPGSIQKLYCDRKSSPWSFGLSLAYVFGASVSPPGTYLHLKLGLLLSLLGNKMEKGSSRMDVLALGADTLIIERLMNYAATFSSKSIHHTTEKYLIGKACRDRHGTGTVFIEGGSLLLAGNGICCLGNIGRFNKQTKETLQQALENNQVVIPLPKRCETTSNAVPQQITLPLQCSVWAVGDTSTQKKTEAKDELHQQQNMGDITKSMADVFGMIYFTDSTCTKDEYAEYMIVHQTLLNSMDDTKNPSSVCLISDQDLRMFLTYASQQAVTFSKAAEKLICGYYVGSRRVRSSSVKGTDIPCTAIQTITSLSCAHAKLNLRQSVTADDALMAIWLYEESITARCGYSVLGVQHTPHIENNDIGAYLGPQNDKRMHVFQSQLLRFCASHASDIDIFTEE